MNKKQTITSIVEDEISVPHKRGRVRHRVRSKKRLESILDPLERILRGTSGDAIWFLLGMLSVLVGAFVASIMGKL